MPKCGLPCEVYSRVVGYYRPVADWNVGKQAEFRDRVTYQVGGDSTLPTPAPAGAQANPASPVSSTGQALRSESASVSKGAASKPRRPPGAGQGEKNFSPQMKSDEHR